MDDELLHKWLTNTLSPEEEKIFRNSPDFDFNLQLIQDAQQFKASKFSAPLPYESLTKELNRAKKRKNWFKPLMRYAAVLILGFTLYFSFIHNKDHVVRTALAEQINITLPDQSSVMLNAESKITYNVSNWEDQRSLTLDGEAFFKVAKGKKFDVVTPSGVVSVLGTQFTVTQREDYFNVSCFEGKVRVAYNKDQIDLLPGDSFRILHGTIASYTHAKLDAPSWLNNKSTFRSVPLKLVLNELERQFNITVEAQPDAQEIIFNGAFTHQDLDQALKQITLPLSLTYSISANNNVSISVKKP